MVHSECNRRCTTYCDDVCVFYDTLKSANYTGTTYAGQFKGETTVAVKIIQNEEETEQYFPHHILQDWSEDDCLVQYHGIYTIDTLKLVVLDPFDTDMNNLQSKAFSKVERLEFIKNVCRGVHILHTKLGIIHRDINPNNILLIKNADGTITAKLANSGIGRKVSDNCCATTTTDGTQIFEWMSPAYLAAVDRGDAEYTASTKDDIFSLGILIYYIYSNGKHAFGNPSWRLYNMVSNVTTFDDSIEENFAFQNLIRAMLSNDPEKRPTIGQVINHPFFWSYEFSFRFITDVTSNLGSFISFQNLESRLDILNDFSGGWHKALDSEWIIYLEKLNSIRKEGNSYNYQSFIGLLRFIRDKFECRSDWATEDKLVPLLRNDERTDSQVDESSYMRYIVRKFPKLILVLATTDGIESLPLSSDFILPPRSIFELGPSNEDYGEMRQILNGKITGKSEIVPRKNIHEERTVINPPLLYFLK